MRARRGGAVLLGLALASAATPVSAYSPEDAGYLYYAEMVDAIHEIEADNPEIVTLFSIGQSYEGRELPQIATDRDLAAAGS